MIPTPASLKSKSSAHDLKSRLDWGEPALTIVDVRDRAAFNACHIQGAISLIQAELIDRALANFELMRDIYIYGATDDETAEAASMLREAGYQNVAELAGGLAGWQANGFPVESISAMVG